jgi:hypothetical protein
MTEPLGGRVRQAAEQDGVDDAEDGRVRADAEGEHPGDGRGEAPVAPQRAERVAQVGEHAHPSRGRTGSSATTQPSRSWMVRVP